MANATNTAIASAARMRLDPWSMPASTQNVDGGGFSFSLDRNGAVMRRRLSCGLNLSIALPARAFRGVAARAIENEDGSLTVTLRLQHADPALSIPLLVADNLDDIAADWHAWARLMKLPMLIVESDGATRRVQKLLGEIMVNPPLARKKLFGALKHRPWFLRRRKTGVVSEVVRITGEELIARR